MGGVKKKINKKWKKKRKKIKKRKTNYKTLISNVFPGESIFSLEINQTNFLSTGNRTSLIVCMERL